MEAGVISLFGNFGTAGMIGLFLWVMMQNQFKQQDKLLEKIDKLIDNINTLAVKDTQKTKEFEAHIETTKAIHLSNKSKIENIAEKVEGIDIRTQLCPNINQLIKEKNVMNFSGNFD